MRNEQRRDDARSLMWIGGSALAGVLLTGQFFAVNAREEVRHYDVRVRVERPGGERPVVPAVPLTGGGRLYGRVTARDGAEYVGFIRWDRNEGSWTDLLDATKDRGGSQSSIRFGHVQRIDVVGNSRADFVLRSGQVTRMAARSTDLGSGLRALTVEDAAGGTTQLGWRDLARVEFFEAPDEQTPPAERLFGTLTTRDGTSFTGHVAWDVDEIYTSDLLDGDDENGRRLQIAFGAIASIARSGSGSASVVLHTGREMILRGTNDVNSSISGITVSDPELGEVKLGWDDFGEVRFHAPDAASAPPTFDGGEQLRGVVLTRSGETLTGEVRWDADEAYGWEMLNGRIGDVGFQIELGRIARLGRSGNGVTVELRDGRTFDLTGSNDVDRGNRGITVENESGRFDVDWRDFVELRLQP